MEPIDLARKVKSRNDEKRAKQTKRLIEKVEKAISEGSGSVTEICRKVGISVDKFYRQRKKKD